MNFNPIGITGFNREMITAPTKKQGVLFLPGWERTILDHRARAASLLPDIATLIVELQGFGKTKGDLSKITPLDHLAGTVAAYDHACEKMPGPITVVSSSYSSIPTVLLTEHRDVHSLVLRVPLLYRDEDLLVPKENRDNEALEGFRAVVRQPTESSLLLAASKFKGHVLLVSSEDDEVVPPSVIDSYALAFRGGPSRFQHTVMKGAAHSLTSQSHNQEFTRLLLSWLTSIRN